MLYRIAIYRNENGKRVFDHYASDPELEILKPKADGSGVEKAEILPHMITRKLALCFDDVSDTHEVEWGFGKDGKEYYENGIYDVDDHDETDAEHDSVVVGKDVLSLHTVILALALCGSKYVCIGNVWQNPELLEVK